MYNARIFYYKDTGNLIRFQTMDGSEPLPIDEEIKICDEFENIPLDKIGILMYNEYNEKLEELLQSGKAIKVDVAKEPHTFYGVDITVENEPAELELMSDEKD